MQVSAVFSHESCYKEAGHFNSLFPLLSLTHLTCSPWWQPSQHPPTHVTFTQSHLACLVAPSLMTTHTHTVRRQRWKLLSSLGMSVQCAETFVGSPDRITSNRILLWRSGLSHTHTHFVLQVIRSWRSSIKHKLTLLAPQILIKTLSTVIQEQPRRIKVSPSCVCLIWFRYTATYTQHTLCMLLGR